MGNVKPLPVKQSNIEKIAEELRKGDKDMRVVFLIKVDKDGHIEMNIFNPEGNIDHMLTVKQAVTTMVDDLWRQSVE